MSEKPAGGRQKRPSAKAGADPTAEPVAAPEASQPPPEADLQTCRDCGGQTATLFNGRCRPCEVARLTREGPAASNGGYAVEQVPLEDLKPHPRNYREHPDVQLQHIVHSIEEHGFYRNVVVAKDNTILAGHGVVKAAKTMGLAFVPVIRLDLDADDPRALRVLVGDNEMAHLVDINDRELTSLLVSLRDLGVEQLLGTGYDAQTLAALAFVTRPPDQLTAIDENAEWQGMPEFGGPQCKHKVIVSFKCEEDREKFLETIGVRKDQRTRADKGTWSLWWPPRDGELVEPYRAGLVEG